MTRTPCSYKPTKPCESCPWRQDATASDIPNFDVGLAERLAATCPDERGFGPDYGAPWFACHQSRDGREIPCAGWLAVAGRTHPAVRLAVRQGRVNPQALDAGEDWPALHQNYQDVLEKLRES